MLAIARSSIRRSMTNEAFVTTSTRKCLGKILESVYYRKVFDSLPEKKRRGLSGRRLPYLEKKDKFWTMRDQGLVRNKGKRERKQATVEQFSFFVELKSNFYVLRIHLQNEITILF